ncbi:MAG: sugar phosphate isomerase/epimerase [bacterium]|nr:sugar phosphate isomerase/epimerase [bacterium]
MNPRIGTMVRLQQNGPSFDHLVAAGLRCCQLVSWEPSLWTPECAARLKNQIATYDLRVTAFWAGWPGPAIWNLVDGPRTLGLLPQEYRAIRVASLKRAADFAHLVGLPAIITHVGFVPEEPANPLFHELVATVRDIALYADQLGLQFWFETGQETPVTLLRLILSVNTPNLGINLDPANLILYGKGNPIDALDVFGSYVRNVHAKDAFYPTDPMQLGREVKVGEGRVRFPEFVRRLEDIGFTGEYIIEREISGNHQHRDILDTIHYLDRLLTPHT